jgi:hypothetical protein
MSLLARKWALLALSAALCRVSLAGEPSLGFPQRVAPDAQTHPGIAETVDSARRTPPHQSFDRVASVADEARSGTPVDTSGHSLPSRYAAVPDHNFAHPGVHPHAHTPAMPPSRGLPVNVAAATSLGLQFSSTRSYVEATLESEAEARAREADKAAAQDTTVGVLSKGFDVLREQAPASYIDWMHSSLAKAEPSPLPIPEGSPFADELVDGRDPLQFPLLDHLASAVANGEMDMAAAETPTSGSDAIRPDVKDLHSVQSLGLSEPTAMAALHKALIDRDSTSVELWMNLEKSLTDIQQNGVVGALQQNCDALEAAGLPTKLSGEVSLPDGWFGSVAKVIQSIKAFEGSEWTEPSAAQIVKAGQIRAVQAWGEQYVQTLARVSVQRALRSAISTEPTLASILSSLEKEPRPPLSGSSTVLAPPPFLTYGRSTPSVADASKLQIPPSAMAAPWLVLGSGTGAFAIHAARRLVNTSIVSVSWPVHGTLAAGPPSRAQGGSLRNSLTRQGGLPYNPITGAITSTAKSLSPAYLLSKLRDAEGLHNLVVAEAPVNEDLVSFLSQRALASDSFRTKVLSELGLTESRNGKLTTVSGAFSVEDEALTAAPAPVRFGVVTLLDLQSLADGRLPQEVETFIGSILKLCRYIVVPKDLPERQYFSYWSSTAALIEAAAAASGMRATIRELGGENKPTLNRTPSTFAFVLPGNGIPPPSDEVPEPKKSSNAVLLVAVQTLAEHAAAQEAWQAAADKLEEIKQARKGDSPSSSSIDKRQRTLSELRKQGKLFKRVALPTQIGGLPWVSDLFDSKGAPRHGTTAALRQYARASAVALTQDALYGTCASPGVGLTRDKVSALIHSEMESFKDAAKAWSARHSDSSHSMPSRYSATVSDSPLDAALKRLDLACTDAENAVIIALAAVDAGPGLQAAARFDNLWNDPLSSLPKGLPLDVLLGMGPSFSDRAAWFQQLLGSPANVPEFTHPHRILVTAYGIDHADGPAPLHLLAREQPPILEAREPDTQESGSVPSKKEKSDSKRGPQESLLTASPSDGDMAVPASDEKQPQSSGKAIEDKEKKDEGDSLVSSKDKKDESDSLVSSKDKKDESDSLVSSKDKKDEGDSLVSSKDKKDEGDSEKNKTTKPEAGHPPPMRRYPPGYGPKNLRAMGGRKLLEAPSEVSRAGVVPAIAEQKGTSAEVLLSLIEEAQHVQTGSVRPLDAVAGPPTRDSGWSASHAQSLSSLLSQNGATVTSAWNSLKEELSGTGTVLVAGDSITTLAPKIARTFRDMTVVGLFESRAAVGPLARLGELLNLKNLLVARGKLTPARAAALQAVPDVFRFQFLGREWAEGALHLAHDLEGLERQLGDALRLASTTFLHVPSWSRLLWAVLAMRGGMYEPASFTPKCPSMNSHYFLDEVSVTWGGPFGPQSLCSALDDPAEQDKPSTSSPHLSVESLLLESTHPSRDGSRVVQSSKATVPLVMRPLRAYEPWATDELNQLVERYDSSRGATPIAADSPSSLSASKNGKLFSEPVHNVHDDATAHRLFGPLLRIIAKAAVSAGLRSATIRIVHNDDGESAVIRLDVAPWAQLNSAAAPPSAFPVAVPLRRSAALDSSLASVADIAPLEGVSLHTLLVLGIAPHHRAEFLRLMLRLPLPLAALSASKLGWSVVPTEAKTNKIRAMFAAHPWYIRYFPPSLVVNLQSQSVSAMDFLGMPKQAPASPSTDWFAKIHTTSADAASFSASAQLALVLLSPSDILERAAALGSLPRTVPKTPTSVWIWSSSNTEEQASVDGGSSAALTWAALSSQLVEPDTASGGSPGKFSFLDLGAGAGSMSLRVAEAFPEATVISVEEDAGLTDIHAAQVMRRQLFNDVVCRHSLNDEVTSSLLRSPEFLRFSIVSPDVVSLLRRWDRKNVERFLGGAIATAASSFLKVPSAESLSIAFTTLFHTYPDPDWVAPPSMWGQSERAPGSRWGSSASTLPDVGVGGIGEFAAMAGFGGSGTRYMDRSLAMRFVVGYHPRPAFHGAETRILAKLARPDSAVHVTASPIVASPVADGGSWSLGSGLVRVDIVNMTRHVNHHFQSEIDGHERTYTLHVQGNSSAVDLLASKLGPSSKDTGAIYGQLDHGNHPNAGGVMSVRLYRDKDSAFIPYVTVHGVTLITVLRLGLLSQLRPRAYSQFVHLPLYEDMAPWNIVFLGSKLDYIDYDTKDKTYDHLVPKAYEIMEVLFNYKRTVQDFQQCGSKGNINYGFSYVSDCVGSPEISHKCPDSAKPVPCADGKCHSDYISCLRALADKDDAALDAKRWKSMADSSLTRMLRRHGVSDDAAKAASSVDEDQELAQVWVRLQAKLPKKQPLQFNDASTASKWLDSDQAQVERAAMRGRWEANKPPF